VSSKIVTLRDRNYRFGVTLPESFYHRRKKITQRKLLKLQQLLCFVVRFGLDTTASGTAIAVSLLNTSAI